MFTTPISIIIQIIFDLAMLGIFLVSAIHDYKSRIVRPWTQFAALGLAVLHTVFIFIAVGWQTGLWYVGTGVIMFLLQFAMYAIFKGKGIGGADIKMTSIIALYLNLWPTVILMVTHSVAGVSYSLFEKIAHKRYVKSVPLLVFLTIGLVFALAFEWIFVFV